MKRQMDDEFLDEVLRKVQEVNLHYYDTLEATYTHDEVIYKLMPAIEFLLENGYITSRDVGSQKYLDIAPKGIRLEQEGGFAQATKDKKELFRYTKGSHDYAKKAYFVGLGALILAIVAVVLSLSC